MHFANMTRNGHNEGQRTKQATVLNQPHCFIITFTENLTKYDT